MTADPAVISLPRSRSFDDIETALDALARGGLVVVVDDEARKNEGDLLGAAEFATRETMAFFVRHTSGFLCVALPAERADELGLPPLVPPSANADPHDTDYGVAVDAAEGITTGISAADRARTARLLAASDTRPADLKRPGHVLSLRARAGGVLERAGHTEAAVDLCRFAGLTQAGVLGTVVAEDGSTARRPELSAFARLHDLPIVTVGDLAAHRRRHETAAATASRLTTPFGTFTAHAYRGATGIEHLALTVGEPGIHGSPLVYLHRECVAGELFGCDCAARLRHALRAIGRAGTGVLVHLGGGPGLVDRVARQDAASEGADCVEAAAILRSLGVHTVRLMKNSAAGREALTDAGIEVTDPTSGWVTESTA